MDKFISYLLNITLLIGVFIGTVFYLGPALISMALVDPVEKMTSGDLQYLHIDYLNGRKGN